MSGEKSEEKKTQLDRFILEHKKKKSTEKLALLNMLERF